MSKLSVVTAILLFIIPFLNARIAVPVNGIVEQSVIDDRSAVKSLPVTGKKGITFVKQDHLANFGIDLVGCRNAAYQIGVDCDAYTGDTECTELRPVLCAKIDNAPRPAYTVAAGGAALPSYAYYGWNRGHISTTFPVQASQFSNRADVDAYCATSFGVGWRVAEFHDGVYIYGMNGATYAGASWTQNAGSQQGGGWNFYSYGDVRNDIRFWVHISDQPSTCWAQ